MPLTASQRSEREVAHHLALARKNDAADAFYGVYSPSVQ